MRTSNAEWIMAASTVITGFFVGYQSLLLRDSLESPFGANLQDRQIAVCAAAIQAKGALRSFGGWFEQHKDLELESRSVPYTGDSADDPQIDDKMVIDPEARFSLEKFVEYGYKSNFGSSNNTVAEMRAALAELRIYSSVETVAEIDALEDSFPSKSLGIAPWSTDASDDAWIDSITTRFAPIEQKCRSVMLGETKGLI